MIDPTKNLIILTHPRSGSTWFQSKLSHFNCHELFNLGVRFHYTPKGPKAIEFGLKLTKDELQNRIRAFNHYKKQYRTVSIKIHLNQLHDGITDFIKSEDFEIIDLRRRDIPSALMSYIIAVNTQEWTGEIQKRNIKIDYDQFCHVIESFQQCKLNNIMFHNLFPNIKTIYYEDSMHWNVSSYWKFKSWIRKQDAKSITVIENLDALNRWISALDYTELFPPDHEGLPLIL